MSGVRFVDRAIALLKMQRLGGWIQEHFKRRKRTAHSARSHQIALGTEPPHDRSKTKISRSSPTGVLKAYMN